MKNLIIFLALFTIVSCKNEIVEPTLEVNVITQNSKSKIINIITDEEIIVDTISYNKTYTLKVFKLPFRFSIQYINNIKQTDKINILGYRNNRDIYVKNTYKGFFILQ